MLEGMSDPKYIPLSQISGNPEPISGENPDVIGAWIITPEQLDAPAFLEIQLVDPAKNVAPVLVGKIQADGIPEFSVEFKDSLEAPEFKSYYEGGQVKVS